MPNYKEMYLTMMRASEKAINILIEAQQKCEEMYLSDDSAHKELKIVSIGELLSLLEEQE